ncbi:bifunctional demethylmenaquinone methyltransferase/2-methoxy-6-polyprenyl-1,4-benzoquinol methylase UbiE [Haoranjiania flava]|uniref:Demethylmenaquinone methyltransferase n=1 Tax=Haoranjiania flava TaxID=1856322 RepID=A0AAE3IND9_9BACT|nr:bifunctional demethylmenaquinone methyltransferase/2-methoxy-6-polyprenyl-1,4-benzoquinol methylase UbiE [Haoranjiania flava]MCU7695193.1 bifunctional demethylmenaquinone methyltransferase/2-methoxy-6-polyprenyl-1,4-benzoquinol methylase UbiE [Haoranjiania flava]
MSKFAHDTVTPYRHSDKEKKQQVAEMFDDVASKYDFLNRFLSMGIDQGWRKKAIRRLTSIKPQSILDVATGTGDFAIMTYKMLTPGKITGIDISKGMLEVGREKVAKEKLSAHIEMMEGDSENLPFKDNSFDAVTVSFGVRNFQNLEKGIAEMYRILRPGGKLVILEFSRPKNPVFKLLYRIYMQVVTPNVGKMISKSKTAYQYLNDSIMVFPERKDFVTVMDGVGFTGTSYEALTMGICCIYEGSK